MFNDKRYNFWSGVIQINFYHFLYILLINVIKILIKNKKDIDETKNYKIHIFLLF